MGRKKKRFIPEPGLIVDLDHPPLPALPPDDEKLKQLAQILADPKDPRSDEDLSVDLGIPLIQIRHLRNTPSFFEPVLAAFKRNLGGIAPDIIKTLYQQVKGGSGPASKLLLEATGMVSGSGAKVQVNVGSGGSAVDDKIARMSDDELDREAHRLLMDTFPEDVIYSQGKVSPVNEEDVVDIEEVEDHEN